MEFLILGIRVLLGAVFLMSAASKVPAPNEFVENVRKYRILPRRVATAYAMGLLTLEPFTGLALILGYYTSWAAVIAALMLMSFITAVSLAILRRQALECSCFGLLYRERVGWVTLARDVLLLGLALILALWGSGSPTVSDLVSNLSHAGYVMALAAVTMVLGFSVLVAYLYFRDARIRRTIKSEFEAQFQPMVDDQTV